MRNRLSILPHMAVEHRYSPSFPANSYQAMALKGNFYRSALSSTPIKCLLPHTAAFTGKHRRVRSSNTLGHVLSLGAIEHSFFWTFITTENITPGVSRRWKRERGSWVGTRRSAVWPVSSSPRLAPCVRLSPHTAQHLRSFSLAYAMKRPFAFLQHARSTPCTACAFAGYLCSGLSAG